MNKKINSMAWNGTGYKGKIIVLFGSDGVDVLSSLQKILSNYYIIW